ncbi:hypothetical protein [Amycolatopsis kentuckyensis]|uniref:hypothetical protein n=1 Tax=Amycolatopsis kentuckyensis TaxID=218823 RepID=UPI001177FD72|nr:hypothetical protein [Amycolatopsis kentuckyensis]
MDDWTSLIPLDAAGHEPARTENTAPETGAVRKPQLMTTGNGCRLRPLFKRIQPVRRTTINTLPG